MKLSIVVFNETLLNSLSKKSVKLSFAQLDYIGKSFKSTADSFIVGSSDHLLLVYI